jgi:hypothetical protein
LSDSSTSWDVQDSFASDSFLDDARRNTHDLHRGWYVFRHDRSGANYRSLSDRDGVEDLGAHPDVDAIADRAKTGHVGSRLNRDVVADCCVMAYEYPAVQDDMPSDGGVRRDDCGDPNK